MKNVNIILVVLSFGFLLSCGGGVSSSKQISNKEEYVEFKKEITQCKADFKTKTISAEKYSAMMEKFGDVYKKSVAVIPPEVRYTGSIACYKEALRHNKTNAELKQKLQEQQSLYQVVNQ